MLQAEFQEPYDAAAWADHHAILWRQRLDQLENLSIKKKEKVRAEY